MKTPKLTSLNDATAFILGGSRQVILNASYTDGDVYLVQGVMPKGSVVPIHVHQHEDEIFHVLEGEVELVLGDETLTGRPGDIIYLPRGIKHGISTKGDEPAKVLNYVIPGGAFEQFFNEMNDLGIKPSSPELGKLAEKYGITFV